MTNTKAKAREERFCFRQDDACHWYLVPLELIKKFDALVDLVEDDEDKCEEFNQCFEKYRIGTLPTSYSFTSPKDLYND